MILDCARFSGARKKFPKKTSCIVYAFWFCLFLLSPRFRSFFLQTLSKVQRRSHLDAISYAIQIETKIRKKKSGRRSKRPQPKTTKSCCDKFWFLMFSASFSCYCHSPWRKKGNDECKERSLNLKLDGNVFGNSRWLQTMF